ncbi:hypothetical protein QVD17_25392 [Tagetes erecta]|uniref:Uncharacterized protein n=1 Tax=Tagetes erecta TaxID=13708 RepID=A0AAD8NL66_TARER|nr:hypothetical protein QVD17_33616 [Tagetes erecta]KAK1415840.1 hypothetical protein QVD17_31628 [Tagetes erecta]KAK1422344.1 hypothetical protein QVD17_25392 [Tagetes erecta]
MLTMKAESRENLWKDTKAKTKAYNLAKFGLIESLEKCITPFNKCWTLEGHWNEFIAQMTNPTFLVKKQMQCKPKPFSSRTSIICEVDS